MLLQHSTGALQAAAEAPKDAFGNQSLLAALHDPRKVKPRLQMLCGSFAAVTNKYDKLVADAEEGKLQELLLIFGDTMDVVRAASKGFLCLLSLKASGFQASVANTNVIRNYKGSDVFLSTLVIRA